MIETAAEVYSDLYLSDNSSFNSGECGINVMRLVDAELIDYETTIMDDGNSLKDLCVYYKNNNYTIIDCACEVGD